MAIFKCTVPETYAPVILKRRAQRLRKETGDQNIATEQELFKVSLSAMLIDTLIRPFGTSASPHIYLGALSHHFRSHACHRAHPAPTLTLHRFDLRSSRTLHSYCIGYGLS